MSSIIRKLPQKHVKNINEPFNSFLTCAVYDDPFIFVIIPPRTVSFQLESEYIH